jgi:hypothetical protein
MHELKLRHFFFERIELPCKLDKRCLVVFLGGKLE